MRSKEALFILALAVTPATAVMLGASVENTTQSSYCDGWNAGYKAGWCYQRLIPEPMPPPCPFPEFRLDTYVDGYNRGFVQGIADRPAR